MVKLETQHIPIGQIDGISLHRRICLHTSYSNFRCKLALPDKFQRFSDIVSNKIIDEGGTEAIKSNLLFFFFLNNFMKDLQH